ncbi:uncharacterized protein LOC110738596 [Chenopodium quinoa]|uniref:uncharacterized protein LOC110738596 n=1 Tax=Chenopodium quinoa TaxID=63459 RepID=UPI000B796C09|nr:uncharacterized protein LOC110738596 [Chenopodium quinoa]
MADNEDGLIDIVFRVGGAFVTKQVSKSKHLLCWCGGLCYWRRDVVVDKIDLHYLRVAVVHGFVNFNVHVPPNYRLWYKERGRTFNTGRRELVNEEEVKGLLETVNGEGYVEVFVTANETLRPIHEIQAQSTPVKVEKKGKKSSGKPAVVRKSPRINKNEPKVREGEESPKPRSRQGIERVEGVSAEIKGVPGKGKLLSKGKQKGKAKLERGSGSVKVLDKGKGKKKSVGKGLIFEDSSEGSETGREDDFSSSDGSEIDITWEPGEEEYDSGDERWFVQNSEEILAKVTRSLGKQFDVHDEGVSKDPKARLTDNLDVNEVQLQEEIEGESDDLRSLDGSSDEEDKSPWFDDKSDFSKPVVLVHRLRFSNATVLRKALRVHAIQNRYEYYFLHNDSTRITIQCRNRCGCKFDTKTSRMPLCICRGGVKCSFKIHATKLKRQQTWQIKTMKLEHKCVRSRENKKVTAEFIAERYLEEFRTNPSWKVKQIKDRVLHDLGVEVTYYRAWMARCRAKLIIFGSAREQYARVWDYGKAVLKYNPGSGRNVVINGIEKPEPPLFMRMFICLRPLKDGFLKGCRPIIGVDGCHLKGGYPGQILVAVSKDGNNSIYPIAWATCEVENRETWVWFLESLMQCIGSADGAGFTFMSDRQKGLVEALSEVVPNAETRFCVRHIWANFKLKFTGSVFKELFWSAARATTFVEFQIAMQQIRELDEDAYNYLENIPTHHWCRHAFSDSCRSNMLLNNMCETFNSVIRDARDKPILTQMEWMRRYMMRRNNEKWEDSKEITTNITPYVHKLFQRMSYVARNCIIEAARDDTYEVQLNDDQVLVDFPNWSCSCNHWQLTGIPCIHAFACIMDQRVDAEQFVHPYYTMDTYRAAYEPAIQLCQAQSIGRE